MEDVGAGERSEGPRELRHSLTDRWGGPSAEDVVSRLQRPDMRAVRAVVSWRGTVLDGKSCPVWLAVHYLDVVQEESCGRCTPCRLGTQIMRRSLRLVVDGRGSSRDLEIVREFAVQVEEAAWCGIADTLRDPILGLLDADREHFEAHLAGKTCPEPTTYSWVAAPCRSTCPSTVDCPTYIFQAAEEHPHLATTVVRRDNPLPAVIGRTCHHPCETNCTLVDAGQPIAINHLKRWAADHTVGLVPGAHRGVHQPGVGAGHEEIVVGSAVLSADRSHGAGVTAVPEATSEAPDEVAEQVSARPDPLPIPSHGAAHTQRVAVIGAGPAGLSAAYYLARRGYRPVIFEALPVPGGMLYVGIPEYRLPKAVLYREVGLIEREGVEIHYNQAVGRDLAFSELPALGFASTFIGVGAHSGKRLRIPGEELPGSLDAIDFLRQVALGEPVRLGRRVLVVGGGNSAMDAARTALRLGADEVTVVYRRAREQMPANPWEVDEAMEEGVAFRFLAAPVSCEGDTCVLGLVCQEMELGPPDESGRRSPVPKDCAPFHLDADSIISAVGQAPDFGPFAADPELSVNEWGYLDIDPLTFMTTKPGVFVGGDAISGGASVIEAIHAGKTAAKYMDAFLRGRPVVEDMEDKARRLAVQLGAQASRYRLVGEVDQGRRQPMPMLDPAVRKKSFEACELGYGDAQALEEARRCLRCHRPLLVAVDDGVETTEA